MKQFGSLFLALIFHVAIHTSDVATQSISSPAPAPVPSAPRNITRILKKASSHFTTFNRLLKSTGEADQINTILNSTSNQGLTMFAPTDTAFSSLPAGTLNMLSEPDKIRLVQFHVLTSFVPFSEFPTMRNPLPTEVGEADKGQFQLNVTVSGNRVRVSTGVVNTTVSNTIYSDGQIVIYEVDDVLLPFAMFGVAPAPAPEGRTKSLDNSTITGPSSSSSTTSDDGGDASDALTAMNYYVGGIPVYSFMIVVVVVLAF